MNIKVVYKNVPNNNKYYMVQGENVKFCVSRGVKIFFKKNWKLRL